MRLRPLSATLHLAAPLHQHNLHQVQAVVLTVSEEEVLEEQEENQVFYILHLRGGTCEALVNSRP